MTTTRVSRCLAAPRSRVYSALTNPADVATWRFPRGMACEIHEFDPREGGAVRVSLTYRDENRAGKTTGRTDTYRGRFVTLVPGELVIEVDEFETADPDLRGEMTMTIRLEDAAGGGTNLIAVHEDLPPGVAATDNEVGWQQALARLAALVEGSAPDG